VGLEHLIGGRHLDGGLGVAEGEVKDLREEGKEEGREGGRGAGQGFILGRGRSTENKRDGCRNEGLEEVRCDGEGRREGEEEEKIKEGRKGGREGGRERTRSVTKRPWERRHMRLSIGWSKTGATES